MGLRPTPQSYHRIGEGDDSPSHSPSAAARAVARPASAPVHSPTRRSPVARHVPPRCVQGSTTRTSVRAVSQDRSARHLDQCRVSHLARLTRHTVVYLVHGPLRRIASHSRQSDSFGRGSALFRTSQSCALATCITSARDWARGDTPLALSSGRRDDMAASIVAGPATLRHRSRKLRPSRAIANSRVDTLVFARVKTHARSPVDA